MCQKGGELFPDTDCDLVGFILQNKGFAEVLVRHKIKKVKMARYGSKLGKIGEKIKMKMSHRHSSKPYGRRHQEYDKSCFFEKLTEFTCKSQQELSPRNQARSLFL